MGMTMEVWNAGARDLYAYTEDAEMHRELSRFNPSCATYEKGGRIFAWQHRIDRDALRRLGKKVAKMEALKTKGLQDTGLAEIGQGTSSAAGTR